MRYLIPLVTLFGLATGAQAEESRPARPNIIIMMVDDMGLGDTSAYLGKSLAPNAAPIARTRAR